MVLNQDFKEFFISLNANQVQYLVIGGYAVAFHGYPRYTKDIDVWIARDPENAQHMIAALDDFGFGSLGLEASDFLEPDQIIQLGYPPNRINILLSIAGVDFASCFASRVIETIDDTPISFIDRESLLRNKRATGRYQDLADAENLEP